MKSLRFSITTLLLTVLVTAVWIAFFVTSCVRAELKGRLEILSERDSVATRLRKNQDQHSSEDIWIDDTKSRLSDDSMSRYSSVIGTDGQHFAMLRPEVEVIVPSSSAFQLQMLLVEKGEIQIKESAILPPGTHTLRWDSRLNSAATKVHFGAQVNGEWVMRQEYKFQHPLVSFNRDRRIRKLHHYEWKTAENLRWKNCRYHGGVLLGYTHDVSTLPPTYETETWLRLFIQKVSRDEMQSAPNDVCNDDAPA